MFGAASLELLRFSTRVARKRLLTDGGAMAEKTSVLEAPDFTLDDVYGRPVRLSDFRGQKHVVLVFNRGFM